MDIINCDTFNKVLVHVQKGDSIQRIAQSYNANINNIIRNDPNIELYEGELIKIVRNNKKTHIVKPMQTLDLIARDYGITVEKLISINNLKSTRLFIGQMIELE